MSLANMLRLTLMLALLVGIFLAIGYFIGGVTGMTIALVIAFLMNFLAYWFSDKIVLAMYGAKPLENEKIEKMVRKLAEKAKIGMPKLYIVETPQPNAFATGRDKKHCAIAVTTGLLETLNDKEIEGVLAHEVAHIKNRDMLISTIAATIAGAISYIAEIFWWSSIFGEEEEKPIWAVIPVIILAPIAALLIQLAISRGREFLADETGAKLTGKPEALASALRKISQIAEENPLDHGSVATSHMWIVNPFKGDFFVKLFSTHPPVEERIKRLEMLKV
ncbi:MAG TPA: protease HtpX [Nanoarchaeota archaeon]|nr:protease HtpX [Nanoarchaeota archaeon]